MRGMLCSFAVSESISVFAKKEEKNGILLPKLFCPTVRKKCSSDQEKRLKFEAEGREFTKKIEIKIQIVLK